MKKVQVRIIDQNKLEILEDASKGDIIDLMEVVNVDTSKISEAIKNAKDKEYQKAMELELNRQKELFNLELQAKLNQQEQAFNERLQKENEIKRNLEGQIKDANTQYANELKLKEKELEDLKENASKEAELKYLKEQQELIKKHSEEKEALNKTISDLTREKEQLTYQKSSLSVKLIGESLEKYCNREAESYMENGFYNCTWEKDNKSVKAEDEENGTKADYIFKVYYDETHTGSPISSVCLEMKDEDPTSKQKKKDRDYFKRLDENRNKKELKYALLVSNLEFDNEAKSPIYRVKDYPDMYVVRPNYMMVFLNMITSLSMKFAEAIKNQKVQELMIKNKLDLQEEFEELKTKYLENPLDTLERKVEEIVNEAQKIQSSAKKIETTASEIINSRIASIKNKIATFEIEINKKYKKFEKLEENN